MKVLPELYPTDFDSPPANELILPHGIIGFSQYKRAELLYLPDHLPFLWMKLGDPDESIHFIVIEPGGIVPGYEPEISDEDISQLGIRDQSEAMILNIVTLKRQNPVVATTNLIGPIVVNRRTRVGRQLVITNYSRYNAHHALVENSQAIQVASTA
jgi:flagellar assembly factor FliW